MLVREVLERKGSEVVSVGSDQAIWAVLRKFQINRVGALVVTNEAGDLVGLLSERDLVHGLASRGKQLIDLTVREVMTTDVPTCTSSDRVTDVMSTMTNRRVRHLPVVDSGRLRGLISIGDAVKARLDDAALENRVLRDLSRSHHA